MLSRSRFNPVPGVQDFWTEFKRPQPYRWLILLASSVPVALILFWAIEQTVVAPPARPEVTYITSFAPDRSDAEIVASNQVNQARKDELAARQAEIDERKKEMYRALGRATGIDVDAMEAEIEAERAREAAAAEAARQEQGSESTSREAALAE